MNEIEQAIQEFYDNAFHHSLKPEISAEANALAIVALHEKAERDKKIELTEHEKKTQEWFSTHIWGV